MLQPRPKLPLFPAAWVVLCAVLNCSGWILSALGWLNVAGYCVIALPMAVLVFWLYRASGGQFQGLNVYRQRRRFRRAFPLAFLVLAAMAFIGGAIFAPTNYDAMAYRMPRVLHWLAAGHWHWIHTTFNRVNSRACGVEWLLAPLIAFTKSDRLIFLTNTVSFLLLPGLYFSMMTRMGVRRRTAWFWMWLAPSGYTYIVQAGSIGNDLFGAVFALAAMDFALRAQASKSLGNLWLAIMAAAMLTGCKTSNLPLLLPWCIAVFPALPLLFKRVGGTVAVLLVATGASFLPMAALNYKYCGDWSGAAAEGIIVGRHQPVLQVEHNALLLLSENLVPPVFPWASAWNDKVVKWIPPERAKLLAATFEPGQATLKLAEMQTEEGAGLGMGVTALLLIGLAAKALPGLRRRPKSEASGSSEKIRLWFVCMTPYLSAIVFMTQAGWSTIARLITPYYALLIPAVVRGRTQERFARSKTWQRLGLLVFLLSAVLVCVVPGRPLWPAVTILGKAGAKSPTLKRMQTVYAVYSERAHCFDPAIEKLPPNLKVLGMITFDDPEAALWKPFGSRRIEHVSPNDPNDTPEHLKSLGINYILVSSDKFRVVTQEPFASWLARMNAEVVQTISLNLRASAGPLDWYLVKLRDSPPAAPAPDRSIQ